MKNQKRSGHIEQETMSVLKHNLNKPRWSYTSLANLSLRYAQAKWHDSKLTNSASVLDFISGFMNQGF